MSIYQVEVEFKSGRTERFTFTNAKAREEFRNKAYNKLSVHRVLAPMPPIKTFTNADKAYEDMCDREDLFESLPRPT